MFATSFSMSRNMFCTLLVAAAFLPRLAFTQEMALAAITPPRMGSATAWANAEPMPELSLSLLEKLETLEQLSENSAPVEIKALFSEGLPCQIHSRTEEGAELTEVHPLFSANTAAAEAAPVPMLAPLASPSPQPSVQAITPATSADAPFVAEKIKSLQKMVTLMQAKEKLLESRARVENKLGEFDSKVGK